MTTQPTDVLIEPDLFVSATRRTSRPCEYHHCPNGAVYRVSWSPSASGRPRRREKHLCLFHARAFARKIGIPEPKG